MKAFLNDPKVQAKYISRLEEHYTHDEIIQGQYWENGKGCAVGCTVHSDSHNRYESELGIPEWIARLEDTLFEGMPNQKAKKFPLKLLKAIPIGFENWEHIYHQLCVFILKDVCKNTDHELVKQSICDIITLHMKESKYNESWAAARSAAWSATAESAAWTAAWSAAESAAESAWSAAAESAWAATRSAAWSAAAESAWAATWSATAESAAWSAAAESAARSAAESAWSAAESAWSAESARSAAYYEISEELIRLLEVEK